MAFRVLLTGATGLIGRAVQTSLLASGHTVIAIIRSGNITGAIETVTANLLDSGERRAAIEQANASHLLHLAWHSSPVDRWHAVENLDWAAATLQLVREFADAGGNRAVCVGSCAEYDWSQPLLDENTALQPSSLYGRAKASTGSLLIDAGDKVNLSLAWARLFFCYGHDEPEGRLLGDILNGLAAGRRVPCTDGHQQRDFLHTADIGRALTMLLESNLEGAVNIASGQATPVKSLIDQTSKLMGRPDLIDFGAIPQPPDTPKRLVADISRLRSIGFEPKFDLASGLQDCVLHFQKSAKRQQVRDGD